MLVIVERNHIFQKVKYNIRRLAAWRITAAWGIICHENMGNLAFKHAELLPTDPHDTTSTVTVHHPRHAPLCRFPDGPVDGEVRRTVHLCLQLFHQEGGVEDGGRAGSPFGLALLSTFDH